MSDFIPQEAVFLDGLRSLLASDRLPPAVERTCSDLLDKFGEPICIGIFGPPGAGKKAVLNALVGDVVVSDSVLIPTLEVVPGKAPRTTAMLGDGASLEISGYPDADILAQSPMFLSVASPLSARTRRAYLMAVSDDTEVDMAAGLAWAAARIDLAIWCTRAWTEAEAAVWCEAPDHLLNHAILCRIGGPAAGQSTAPAGFDTALDLPARGYAGNGFTPLVQHVQSVIDRARAEDVLAAELFLRRHADLDIGVAGAEARPERTSGETPEQSASVVSQLAFLFRYVRNAAEELRRAPGPDAELLGPLEDVFEELAGRASECPAIADTWPDLDRSIDEARDLAVLLRLEGRADQAADAARLLLQLRWDMEAKLAA